MLVYVLLVCLVVGAGGERVRLVSDGPVMLDAPIVFTGSLEGGDMQGVYRWTWGDNASPTHYTVEELDGTVANKNYTITFPSDQYGAWEYEMSLTVYKLVVFWWREVGKGTVAFNVTAVPNGKLEVMQDGQTIETVESESIVASVDNTEVSVKFWDPSNYLANARKIVYFWFVDSVPFGQTSEASFIYNFSEPGNHEVEVTVVAYFNTTSSSSLKKPHTLRIAKEDEGARSVVFLKKVISKAPITNVTAVGDTLLKNGQLVDLNFLCDGTGPFLYCWKLLDPGYSNMTLNQTCDQPLFRKTCDFSILWYFKESATYTVFTIISNDVSTQTHLTPVTVYEVAHELPLFIVVIPVVSAVLVAILLIFGISLYVTFKRDLRIEVADFDFTNTEDEEFQYKTFWDRLRESFGNAFIGSHSETQSDGDSSVSGRRSVQLPGPGGIGYGSIT